MSKLTLNSGVELEYDWQYSDSRWHSHILGEPLTNCGIEINGFRHRKSELHSADTACGKCKRTVKLLLSVRKVEK